MGKENRPSRKVWLVALLGTGAVVVTAFATLSPDSYSLQARPQIAAAATDHFISSGLKRIRAVFEPDSPLNYLSSLGDPNNQPQNILPPVEVPEFYDNQYTVESLTISETSATTMSVYLQAFEFFMRKYEYEEDSGLEGFVAIDRWLASGSKEDLQTIKDLSLQYKHLAEDLITIPVPIELAESHLALVNNLYNSARALESVEVTSENPTGGLFLGAHFTHYRSKQSDALILLTQQINALLQNST